MTSHLKVVVPFDSFPGLTVQRLSDAKGLPSDYLPSLGLTDFTYMSRPAVRIPYLDESGELVATRFRLALTDDEGVNRFVWKKGDKPCLYGLWRLSEARKQGRIIIVEGESDCFTLWHLGIPAIGVPGASNWKPERDGPKLDGIAKVYVVIEPDQGGDTLLARLTS
jgi:hypothetical protein